MLKLREWLSAFVKEHPAALCGLLIGLAVAILILCIGFWKTLLIGVMIAIGCGLGHCADQKRSPLDAVLAFIFRIRSIFKP